MTTTHEPSLVILSAEKELSADTAYALDYGRDFSPFGLKMTTSNNRDKLTA
jgi:hypothetical protein